MSHNPASCTPNAKCSLVTLRSFNIWYYQKYYCLKSDECIVISHCILSVHFVYYEQGSGPFHMFIAHLEPPFGALIQIFHLFLNWIAYFSLVAFFFFFKYSFSLFFFNCLFFLFFNLF